MSTYHKAVTALPPSGVENNLSLEAVPTMDWGGNINEGTNQEIAGHSKLTGAKIDDKRQSETHE